MGPSGNALQEDQTLLTIPEKKKRQRRPTRIPRLEKDANRYWVDEIQSLFEFRQERFTVKKRRVNHRLGTNHVEKPNSLKTKEGSMGVGKDQGDSKKTTSIVWTGAES